MSEFRVYRNLHHQDWTVQAYSPKGWRKLAGVSSLWTPDPIEFLVGTKARETVRAKKAKQVHAYAIIGAFSLVDWTREPNYGFVISYTPYNDDGFVAEQVGSDKRFPNLAGANSGVLFHTDGRIHADGIIL